MVEVRYPFIKIANRDVEFRQYAMSQKLDGKYETECANTSFPLPIVRYGIPRKIA